jgi:hypothetical protein
MPQGAQDKYSGQSGSACGVEARGADTEWRRGIAKEPASTVSQLITTRKIWDDDSETVLQDTCLDQETPRARRSLPPGPEWVQPVEKRWSGSRGQGRVVGVDRLFATIRRAKGSIRANEAVGDVRAGLREPHLAMVGAPSRRS